MAKHHYYKSGGHLQNDIHRDCRLFNRCYAKPKHQVLSTFNHRPHFHIEPTDLAFYQDTNNDKPPLRHRPVCFVSTGYSQPLKELEVPQKVLNKITLSVTDSKPHNASPIETSRGRSPISKVTGQAAVPVTQTSERRSSTPSTRSSSSESERLIFTGRANRAKETDIINLRSTPSPVNTNILEPVDKLPTQPQPSAISYHPGKTLGNQALDLSDLRHELQPIHDELFHSAKSDGSGMAKGSHRRAHRRESRHQKKAGRIIDHTSRYQNIYVGPEDPTSAIESEFSAVFHDYANNLTEFKAHKLPMTWAHRDLGGEVGDVVLFPRVDNQELSTQNHFESDGSDLDHEVMATLNSDILIPTSNKSQTLSTHFPPSRPEDDIRIEAIMSINTSVKVDDKSSMSENADDYDNSEDSSSNEDLEDLFSQDIIAISPSNIRKARTRRQKGFSSFIDPDLDPNIIDIMMKSDKRNRQIKVARKQERERLRAEEKLGKRAQRRLENPGNLMAIYSSGMKYEEIQTEIWAFLCDDNRQELNFPPMNSFHRKGLHELAHKLHMTSKSTGKSSARRLTLFKKAGTIRHEGIFLERISWIGRKHFNIKTSSHHGAGMSMRKSVPSTHIYEGQIVGGNVPKIGNDNRGHALLTKMGWNHGTALGSAENKGIMEPVESVMKKSRAGLR